MATSDLARFIPAAALALARPIPLGLVIVAALCNRAGHYIFALWLVSFVFFSSPNLSGRRLDVYHTPTYGVALVRI